MVRVMRGAFRVVLTVVLAMTVLVALLLPQYPALPPPAAPLSCSKQQCFRQRLRQQLRWNDERLLQHIRGTVLQRPLSSPASPNKSYVDPRHPPWASRSSYNQTEDIVRTVTQGQKGGTFVEVGAGDGTWMSNTWFLEAVQGWRGLLVEADPRLLPHLTHSPRAAPVLPLCIAPLITPKQEKMVRVARPSNLTPALLHAQMGRSKLLSLASLDEVVSGETWTTTCYPLPSVLAAFNMRQIDLLTLHLPAGGVDTAYHFLTFNKIVGNPFQVKLVVFQDHELQQNRDQDELLDDARSLGYGLIKLGEAHYILHDASIHVKAVR